MHSGLNEHRAIPPIKDITVKHKNTEKHGKYDKTKDLTVPCQKAG